jgi:hypothetical protein
VNSLVFDRDNHEIMARTLHLDTIGETAQGRAAQAASGERLVRWGREPDTRDARQRAFRVSVLHTNFYLSAGTLGGCFRHLVACS